MKKKNKIKQAIKILVIVIMTIILNLLTLQNSIYAAELGSSANLQNSGKCPELLTYKGRPIITTYVTYNDGENSYPAYCLNANLPGVGENGNYTVSTNNLVSDVGLWRRVINGYPYKTLGELGCCSKEEAFTATKQAIYCYIHGNNIDDYKGIGDAGNRTLNAMKNIITNAQNSNESKLQTSINIDKNSGEWKQDDNDKNYVSKTYKVTANADFKTYAISLEKTGNITIPEGLKITDEKNNEKKTFNKGEKFKVLIPINNLKNNGEFNLSVKSEINSKPVLYGKAPNSSLQDYAVTTLKYEDGEGNVKDTYGKNETKIIILKQDKNSKEPLEGVSFDLLDANKKTVYSGLKTDKDGKIQIEGIMPGKYYLVETNTLDGYSKYDEEINIDVEYNEELKVVVNNSKENKVEVEKNKKEISVKNKAVKKLPVTGM